MARAIELSNQVNPLNNAAGNQNPPENTGNTNPAPQNGSANNSSPPDPNLQVDTDHQDQPPLAQNTGLQNLEPQSIIVQPQNNSNTNLNNPPDNNIHVSLSNSDVNNHADVEPHHVDNPIATIQENNTVEGQDLDTNTSDLFSKAEKDLQANAQEQSKKVQDIKENSFEDTDPLFKPSKDEGNEL